MQTIIFCRVSSREQEETGYSLDAQEKLLREYSSTRSLEVAKVFRISESASGKQIRKLFNEMLTYAVKNNVRAICCEKIDRLTRNLKDAATINDWVQDDSTRQVHFLKENFVLSKDTRAHENLVWDMKVAIARFYTNNLAEEVRKGQKEKIAQGWLPSKAPLGYKTIGEHGHKIHVPDEEKALFISRAFTVYATGNISLGKLAEQLFNEGLRNNVGGKVTKPALHVILSDPFYFGKMKWKNETLPANHIPLISKELYLSVQEKMKRKLSKLPVYRKHLPVFKAKMTCEECGGMITWELQKSHWYGHCNHFRTCSQKAYWRQEKVEEKLFPLFDKIAPKDPELLQILRKALNESKKWDSEYTAKAISEVQVALNGAERRLEAIYDDKVDGKITPEFYAKKYKQYNEEKEAAEDQLTKLNKNNSRYYEAGIAIHSLALRAVEIYQSTKATVEYQRRLLSRIFSNLTLNAEIIRADYTKAFQFLAEWMPVINDTFEPPNKLCLQGSNGNLDPSCPELRAYLYAFRTFDWNNAVDDIDLYLKEIEELNKLANLDS